MPDASLRTSDLPSEHIHGTGDGMAATVYLGQFTDEHADQLVEALEADGIAWSAKSSGAFVRFVFAADWGVRLFVEPDRADDAWAVAERIAPEGLARRRRR